MHSVWCLGGSVALGGGAICEFQIDKVILSNV